MGGFDNPRYRPVALVAYCHRLEKPAFFERRLYAGNELDRAYLPLVEVQQPFEKNQRARGGEKRERQHHGPAEFENVDYLFHKLFLFRQSELLPRQLKGREGIFNDCLVHGARIAHTVFRLHELCEIVERAPDPVALAGFALRTFEEFGRTSAT